MAERSYMFGMPVSAGWIHLPNALLPSLALAALGRLAGRAVLAVVVAGMTVSTAWTATGQGGAREASRAETSKFPKVHGADCTIAPLRRGVWITGKVVEKGTGKPVAATVDYFPLLNNVHAKDHPNFQPAADRSNATNVRHKTDREGRFRIVGLPGGGVVAALTDDRGYRCGLGAEAIPGRTKSGRLPTYDPIDAARYQGLKAVDVPEDAGPFECDLTVERGRSVALRIVDGEGAPVIGATVQGRYPFLRDAGDTSLHGASTTRVEALAPGETRTVVVQHRERKLGALLQVSADEARTGNTRTVMLRAAGTVVGRLVHANTWPTTGGGIEVMLDVPPPADYRLTLSAAELLPSGRFRCEGVPAGGPYRAVAANPLPGRSRSRSGRIHYGPYDLTRTLEIKPGQTVDLGTYYVEPGKPIWGPGSPVPTRLRPRSARPEPDADGPAPSKSRREGDRP